MKKRLVYFLLTILCFAICVLIVNLFGNKHFIRGFIGDVVVTILIYCFIKIFIDINPLKLCILILIFSYTVEFLQYLRFIDYIGLGESSIAKMIIGTTFDLRDLIAYTIGILIAYLLDTMLIYRILKKHKL